jgi:hypothetical protein
MGEIVRVGAATVRERLPVTGAATSRQSFRRGLLLRKAGGYGEDGIGNVGG